MAPVTSTQSHQIHERTSLSRLIVYRGGIMALPYQSHPIYCLRKAIIIIAIIGILLCCIGNSSLQPLTASVIFLATSALFATADLLFYATKKVEHPDQDPPWPVWKIMLGDLVLAVVLQLVFWNALIVLSWQLTYESNFIGAYGALADLLCS